MSRCLLTIVLGACLLAGAAVPPDAGAIPVFARQYRISCTTCHAPFPRLLPYGDEFAGNGFVIPEQESERDYLRTGDDLLRIRRDLPLAIRFDAFAVYRDATDIETDLETPYGIKLLSGGPLARDVSYYFYFYMNERGEVAGVEDAFIQFNDLLGRDLDVMVGQFQTSDPLMKRELRLTYEDYQIYKTRIDDSEVDLTYDRGLMLTYGIEATGTDVVVTLTNGNGKGEPAPGGTFDSDEFKNVAGRVVQSVVPDVLDVGGYVYRGKERLGWSYTFESPLEPGEFVDVSGTTDNEVVYWGPDVTLTGGPLQLRGQYLHRKDDSVFLGTVPVESGRAPAIGEAETDGVIGELVFSPDRQFGRYFLTALYNWVDSDWDEADYETLTFSGTYLLARNLRLTAEYTRDLRDDSNRVVLGTVTAF